MGVRECLFTGRAVEVRDRLPGAAVEAPSLGESKAVWTQRLGTWSVVGSAALGGRLDSMI